MAEYLSLVGVDSLAGRETLQDSVLLMFYYLKKGKEEKFLNYWKAVKSSLSENELLYLIGGYTNHIYETGQKEIPSEIMRSLNALLRKSPSYFGYQLKFFLKLSEGKQEDAKEVLQIIKKKYKKRKEDWKELEKML